MICIECGKTIEFYSAELEAIQDAIAAKHRFEPTYHSLRINGICAECRRQARDRKKEESTAQPHVHLAAAHGAD
jgi:Fur family ferric uptake transcriptional regulator